MCVSVCVCVCVYVRVFKGRSHDWVASPGLSWLSSVCEPAQPEPVSTKLSHDRLLKISSECKSVCGLSLCNVLILVEEQEYLRLKAMKWKFKQML